MRGKPEDKDEAGTGESETEPRIWIEKTLVRGRADREQGEHSLGVALWSPQRAKNGADIYKNMCVREGDVVLPLIDNKQFSGVSIAAGSADDTRRWRVRYEKRVDIHEAFLALGCILICWRLLSG